MLKKKLKTTRVLLWGLVSYLVIVVLLAFLG
uniref:Uncharacterized protein n=1 Tax=Chlorobium phaeobacteroides (strain BS1) TaxID=331678 RepID=B3EKS0_CHLPB